MRIVCLSDTHNGGPDLQVPEGDLLLHAGDHTRSGSLEELESAADWLRSLPHKHKVVIAGNHDFGLQSGTGADIFAPMIYLQDQAVEIEGLRIYGSPWTHEYGGIWAFQKPSGPKLDAVWQQIPEGVDVLITHGPPAGIADRTLASVQAGCPHLAQRVRQVKPGLHLFGHIHEGYGSVRQQGVLHLNAANSAVGYAYSQPAQVVDWNGESFAQVTSEGAGEPLWRYLITRFGPPRQLSGLTPEQAQAEVQMIHAFNVGVTNDKVTFSTVRRKDDATQALSFGVKIPLSWLALLGQNNWKSRAHIPLA